MKYSTEICMILGICLIEIPMIVALCPSGKYGKNCHFQCSAHCTNGDICNESDGHCPNNCVAGYNPPLCDSECPDGSYGEFCEKPCSIHCKNKPCNKFTTYGSCLHAQCESGYSGQNCTTPCNARFFGENCQQECSKNCHDDEICDSKNGECPDGKCKAGYTGKTCTTVCNDGWYGENCLHKCVGNCKQEPCLKFTINGKCKDDKCVPGFKGVACNIPCEDGSYGEGCSFKCYHCANKTACSKHDGVCPGGLCDPGYIWDKCDQRCYFNRYGKECASECHCRNKEPCDIVTGFCHYGCEKRWYGCNCNVSDSVKVLALESELNSFKAATGFGWFLDFVLVFAIVVLSITLFKMKRNEVALKQEIDQLSHPLLSRTQNH